MQPQSLKKDTETVKKTEDLLAFFLSSQKKKKKKKKKRLYEKIIIYNLQSFSQFC